MEFGETGPLMTKKEARRSAGAAILEVMCLKADGRLTPGKARTIYLMHGLWVDPKEKESPQLHFRDRAQGGLVRPLDAGG